MFNHYSIICMKKEFKEISEFFEKRNLSQTDLLDFEKELESTYIDFKSLQLAKSIFKLQCLNYNTNKKCNSEKMNFLITPKKTTKTIKKNRTTINKSKSIHYLLNQLTDENIKKLFLDLLRKVGIYKGRISYELNDAEFKLIQEDYNTFLSNCPKKETIVKPKLKLKKKTKSIHKKSNTVYDKLRNTKSIGKFISIRSK